MEEESMPVLGEETPAPSASETESAPEVETSEAATLEQPTEEATAEEPKQSRAQERISKLAKKAAYWEDMAKKSSPPEQPETGEVTVEEVVKKTAIEVRDELRRDEARRQMVQDAQTAEEKFPQLAEDEDLAADVLALAQGRGISIVAAAEKVLGRQANRAKEVEVAKAKAEQSLKAQAVPQGKKVASGEPQPLNLNQISEEEKESNWESIISNYGR